MLPTTMPLCHQLHLQAADEETATPVEAEGQEEDEEEEEEEEMEEEEEEEEAEEAAVKEPIVG